MYFDYQFVSSLIAARPLLVKNSLAISKQIRHFLNTVACPEANRTVLQSLLTYTGENDNAWERFDHTLTGALTLLFNSTTQICPFELLYGFKPRSEIDLEDMHQNKSNLPKLRALAQKNNIVSSKKSKEGYIKNRIPNVNYVVGDVVLLGN